MTRTDGRGWAYAGAILGAGVSIAANIAHAYVPPPGRPADWTPAAGYVLSSALWSTLAFIGIELLARFDWRQVRHSRAIRWAGIMPVVLVAAVASYLHMSGLLRHYGDHDVIVAAGPLAVDGMMLICTVVLIATGRAATPQRELEPVVEVPTEPAPALVLLPAARPVPQWVDRAGRAPLRIIPAQPPAPAQPEPAQIVIPTIDLRAAQPAQPPRTNGHAHPAQPRRVAQPRAAQPAQARPRSRPAQRGSGRTTAQRRAAVADHLAQNPDASSRVVADAIGEPASTVLNDMRALRNAPEE